MHKSLWGLAVIIVSLASTATILSQQTADSEGIRDFKNGQFEKALASLKTSKDYKDLYYLGLTYEKLGKNKDARKAFEKGFKAGWVIVEDAIAHSGQTPNGAGNAAKAPLSSRLAANVGAIKTALASGEKAFALKADVSRDNDWILRGQFLNALNQLMDRGEVAYSFDGVDKKIRILTKPRPSYPEARNAQGTVMLLTIFSSDGKVSAAVPIRSIGPAYTLAAFDALKRITFEPAQKDGKSVPFVAQIEYTFSIQ